MLLKGGIFKERNISGIMVNFLKSLLTVAKCPLYGGQAVINGVMMKGKKHYAVSLYNKNKVHTKMFPFTSLTQKYKLLGLPFIRGMINIFEMLIVGYKSLNYSSEYSYEAETDDTDSKLFGFFMILSLIFSFIFAIALFKLAPLGIATLIDKFYPLSSIVFNVVDGLVKISIFVAYVFVISLFPDIKDVFRYHGAEHKTINAFEKGKELTINNVRKESTRHIRCGTTFILLVLFLSIVAYIFIPKGMPFFYNLGLRILLLPLIASVSYEFQRLVAKYNVFALRIFLYPGLLLQALTTKEPSVKHLRCGIAALNAVRNKEN